jgi:hypothetical protein
VLGHLRKTRSFVQIEKGQGAELRYRKVRAAVPSNFTNNRPHDERYHLKDLVGTLLGGRRHTFTF